MTAAHSTRAKAALLALAERDPALAALSLWCQHRDGPRTATEGTRITYGPDFTALAAHEQQGLAAHHILHVALRHSARMATLRRRQGPTFDDQLWNLAADAVINEAVLAADHALPRPAITLTGVLATLGKAEGDAQMALSRWDVDRLYLALCAAGAGGVAGGSRRQLQRDILADFDPDVTLTQAAPAPREDDANDATRWRQHVTRAMDAGRAAGRGLGRLGHRIADIPEPRTPWEVILRRLLTRALMAQPRMSPLRPARRWLAATADTLATGRAQPGFEAGQRPQTDVPRLAIGLDASGSIEDGRLALFWAEVIGLVRRLRAELHVLVFDDAIRNHVTLAPDTGRFEPPDMPRGGGTDFRPVIARAAELNASALVMLTDLDGPVEAPPNGLTVIWAVSDATGLSAPFGHLLDLSR